MCDPMTAAVSVIGVGAGLNAYGQIQQGRAANRAAKRNAAAAEEQGRYSEARFRDQAARLVGQQTVAIAKSGRTFSGSVEDVIADTAADMELDALAIRYGASEQAAMQRYSGKMAQYQAGWNALGSVVGAGTSVLMATSGSWGQQPAGGQPFSQAAGTSTGKIAGPV